MDRRSQRRFFTEVLASYRIEGGEPQSTFISDISTSGCRLGDYYSSLKIGDTIELILTGIDPIEAIVARTSPGSAGVEFQEMLEAAVVQHFASYCRSAA